MPLARSAAILVVLALAGAAAPAAGPEVVSVEKIWDKGKHNAFTDLIRWHDKWYCTFREADAHVGGDGKLRVLTSADGKAWESAALIAEKGIDLRDPKLSVTPDGRLMIVAGGSVYEGKTLKGRQPRVAFSKDGKEWSDPQRVLTEGEWLWRVTWYGGKCYGVSYNAAERTSKAAQDAAKTGKVPPGSAEWKLKLVASSDGVSYDLVTHLDVPGNPNETTLRFLPDGEMIALVRREAGDTFGWIGRSKPPYKEWTWKETKHRLGGPNFIRLPNGELWAAGRSYPGGAKTVLARMTADGGYDPVHTFPSGGDTSYPGLVWHDGLLWMSYYSSHEGKSAIYLAKVRLPAADGKRSGAAQPRRPNILFILADDQSYKTVRCYPGSFPWARTPNIDALARSGVRFDRAYLGSWCMPSRASLLTGLHPHAIESMRMEGEYPGSTYDPAKCRFWPAEFRKHGYQTAQIGKWHTGTDAGFGRDWDHQIVWNRPRHPKNAGAYYDDQLLSFDGGKERTTAGYSTDNYTQWACDYIRGRHRDPDKPWYLWLCYGAVHGPSIPAPRHLGAYKDAEVKPPVDIFPPRPGKPAYLDKTQAWRKGPGGVPVMGKNDEKFGDTSGTNPKTHAAWVQQVNECVLAVDEGVGKVLAALKESGQLENTLVVYSADQGFAMGEHGFRHKLAPYDANYASPLIVSMPKTLPEGRACRHPVNAPDLVATFHRFAGLDQPWPMHGRDITPLLKDPEAAWPHAVLYEHTGHDFGSDVTRILAEKGEAAHANVPWYAAVRQGKYKYVRYLRPGEPEEVYDLDADPEELTNLAVQPGNAELLAKLRAAAVAELKRTGADFIPHLPTPTTEKR